MPDDFSKAVDDGLKLSKRIYFGKDRAVAPSKQPPPMERSPAAYLPMAPMVYAVISDPGMVDNPEIPSYQPHMHDRCDAPALIPLQMNGIQLDVDCYVDTAFVRVSGSWRVHCVMGSPTCDCSIAVPMGDRFLPDFGESHAVDILVRDKTGHVYAMRCCIRREGHPKPIFSAGWREFILRKAVRVGDMIIFHFEQDDAMGVHYKLEVQRRIKLLGFEFWAEV